MQINYKHVHNMVGKIIIHRQVGITEIHHLNTINLSYKL